MFPVFLIISFMAGTTKQFLNAFFKSIFIIILFIFAMQVFIITNEDSDTNLGIHSFFSGRTCNQSVYDIKDYSNCFCNYDIF